MSKTQKFLVVFSIVFILGLVLPFPLSLAEATTYQGFPLPWKIVNYGGFLSAPPVMSIKYYNLVINLIIDGWLAYMVSFKKGKRN